MNLAELYVRLTADATGMKRGTDQAAAQLGGLERVAKRVAVAMAGVFSVRALGNLILTNTTEAQNAFAQLEAGVRSTGRAAGFTANQLADIATELQNITGISDEVIQGAQSMLLTFTNIKGDVFKSATVAVADLATRMGGDLQSAAVQVGKALNDPIRGVTALTRVGVSFTQAQKSMISSLVETNRLTEAQGIILAELQRQFGGSAEAARNTLGGALRGLKEDFNSLFEVSRGGAGGAVAAINALGTALRAIQPYMGTLSKILVSATAAWVAYRAAVAGAALWQTVATATLPGGIAKLAVSAAAAAAAFTGFTIMVNRAEASMKGVAASAGEVTSAVGMLPGLVVNATHRIGTLAGEMRAAADAARELAEAAASRFLRANSPEPFNFGGQIAQVTDQTFRIPVARIEQLSVKQIDLPPQPRTEMGSLFGDLTSGLKLPGLDDVIALITSLNPVTMGFNLLQGALSGLMSRGISKLIGSLGSAVGRLFGFNRETKKVTSTGETLAKTFEKINAHASNLPEIVDLINRRRQLIPLTPTPPTLPPPPTSGGGGGPTQGPAIPGGPTVIINNPGVGVNPIQLAKDVKAALINELRLGGTTDLSLAFRRA